MQKQTVVMDVFFNKRIAKIAILSGLVLFGAYEIGIHSVHTNNDSQAIVLKEKKKSPPVKATTKEVENFIKF